ncbi:hypothetical protein H9P43_005064 [Blastocladiella emersonii ATCC 22665]|nr:hypothetical protein H9P43_005064 [Blastocladiella emersonii ATCC 22665]
MYFDNDFVRVLTVHGRAQLEALIAEHLQAKHIVVQLSCSSCKICGDLDNDLAMLSLKYPGDCLFLRANVSKLTDVADWAHQPSGLDAAPVAVLKVLAKGGVGEHTLQAVHGNDGEVTLDAVEALLRDTLQAVPFDSWAGEETSAFEDRIEYHERVFGNGGLDECSYDAAETMLDDQLAALHPTAAESITNLVPHPDEDLDPAVDEDASAARRCIAAETHPTPVAPPAANVHFANTTMDDTADDAVCPCCLDAMALAASTALPLSDDEAESLSNDIDDVLSLGSAASSVPPSPVTGRLRHPLVAPHASSEDVSELLEYVDRLERMKRGDPLPEPAPAPRSLPRTLADFVLAHGMAIAAFIGMVVALAMATVTVDVPVVGLGGGGQVAQ